MSNISPRYSPDDIISHSVRVKHDDGSDTLLVEHISASYRDYFVVSRADTKFIFHEFHIGDLAIDPLISPKPRVRVIHTVKNTAWVVPVDSPESVGYLRHMSTLTPIPEDPVAPSGAEEEVPSLSANLATEEKSNAAS